jgi:2-polyprenyl-6-methoxyphenol hydroxylase-like FAD-dependent oxidoreductase
VLSRAGKAVLVLEREAAYRDRVRGELLQPWGVAEAQRLGLHAALLAAGGVHHTRWVPYDETLAPAEAEAAPAALDEVLPGVPGTLGVGHPAACAALVAAAEAAGAQVLRGVGGVEVVLGAAPAVRYRLDGEEREARCRLVVGADGRESLVRRRAGIPLHATEPRLLGAGLLVEGLRGWPEHQVAFGTEGDLVFYILPQAAGRVRLYLLYPPDQRRRFTGPTGPQDFLGSFPLACIPGSECVAMARPAGPCAVFPMNDTWTDSPVAAGVALVGDAAGYSDPHIGQGLSVALRDVRVLSELLLAGDDWSPHALASYAAERAERMRRLRFCNDLMTTLRGEFGPEARERRRLARARMQAEPELARWLQAMEEGPDAVPVAAFDERVRERLFAPAT